jgi:hypothetical protein
MSLNRVSKLLGIADRFDEKALENQDYKIASNAIDMAVTEASCQDGEPYMSALANITRYATMFDLDSRTGIAQILDVVVEAAAELWPSAHDRDEKYDHKSNNAQTLFQSLDVQPKLEASDPVLDTMKGEALSLLTRYSPDYPGVPLMRVSDGVYQDTMTRKVYDFNHGWVSETGQSYPGGSMAHQTPAASGYLGFQQVFESNNMRTRPRAASDNTEQMVKEAVTQYKAFYQQNPEGNKARGIMTYTDETLLIHFLPEQPVWGRSVDEVKQQLERLVPAGGAIQHDAVEQPIHPSSNIPFSAAGRKVG